MLYSTILKVKQTLLLQWASPLVAQASIIKHGNAGLSSQSLVSLSAAVKLCPVTCWVFEQKGCLRLDHNVVGAGWLHC